MESTSTPRISSPLVDSYVGQNVMVIGKVQQLRGDTAVIEAEGQITANLNRVSLAAVEEGQQPRGFLLGICGHDKDEDVSANRKCSWVIGCAFGER